MYATVYESDIPEWTVLKYAKQQKHIGWGDNKSHVIRFDLIH